MGPYLNHNNRHYFTARFAYLGSDFYGVQEQPGLTTVLGALRVRVREATGGEGPMGMAVSARTDRGVHALENFATFYLREASDFAQAASLPRSDGLMALKFVPSHRNIHARNTLGKIYRYMIKEDTYADGVFFWGIKPRLSVEKMRQAAQYFVGQHDFSSLRGGGCTAGTPIKNLWAVHIRRINEQTVAIEVHGDAFLRRMVRNLVGLLVEVGTGLRSVSDMASILSERVRSAAGIAAPSHGLTLVRVLSPNFTHLGL